MGKPFLHTFVLEKSLKMFFSRSSRPISIKLNTNHPCIKGQPGSLQRGDIHKNAKIGWSHLKISFPRTPWSGKLRFTQAF
jgi:hypothetical protein